MYNPFAFKNLCKISQLICVFRNGTTTQLLRLPVSLRLAVIDEIHIGSNETAKNILRLAQRSLCGHLHVI